MAKVRSGDRTGAGMYAVNDDWLRQHDEPVLEPDLPIVDPHHHLWDRDRRYLLDELLDDVDSGHHVRATVFIQCRSMYRAGGPAELAPVGETDVNGARPWSASGHYGGTRLCAGIAGTPMAQHTGGDVPSPYRARAGSAASGSRRRGTSTSNSRRSARRRASWQTRRGGAALRNCSRSG
jgi:hypothetical protein